MAKSQHLTRNLEIWINNGDDLFDELKEMSTHETDLTEVAIKIEAYFEENFPEDIPEPYNDLLTQSLKSVDFIRLARVFREYLGTDLEK